MLRLSFRRTNFGIQGLRNLGIKNRIVPSIPQFLNSQFLNYGFPGLRNRLFLVLLCWSFPLIIVTSFAQAQPMILTKAQKIYYENTVKNIIRADCGRCHSGPTRNLMDYDSLKAYADSGLLGTMVQGPMRRFAGNDVQFILRWIQDGAPEKPTATPARFAHVPGSSSTGPGGPGCRPGSPQVNVSNGQMTYNNTIRNILAKDCLRCHSGPFRNLATYKNVKMYVDNGLLKTLVSVGGPMHRFAGPDSRQIIMWINNGAPQ